QGFPGKAGGDFNYFYSNTNAVVLALMAEAVSGQSFDTLLETYVTTPLALGSAALQTAPGNASIVGTEAGVPVENLDPTIPWTSGAMMTNMTDLLTFLDAINHEGFLSPELTAARTAAGNLNEISMNGMSISYGLGLMRLDFSELLKGVPAATPDLLSTGHGGSIAGASSFSGWLSSAAFPDLDNFGLAVHANSLSTIDKGGYLTGTSSEALFVQALEHLYRAARADGTMIDGRVAQGETGGFMTQTPYEGTLEFIGNPNLAPIAYLDLRGNPDSSPVRITLDPTYTFYSADTQGHSETALEVGDGQTISLPQNVRIEGYGAAKHADADTFTLLHLAGGTAQGDALQGEIAAYGENAIALASSHTNGTLTLDSSSRLYSKGIGGVGLSTSGAVIIGSSVAPDSLEAAFGVAGITVEGSQGVGIEASGRDARITLQPGASVAAVTYAVPLDSSFNPVDAQRYAVYGAKLENGAQMTVNGNINAAAAYAVPDSFAGPWNGNAAPGNGTLAVGVELRDASLAVQASGQVSASGYGVDFAGGTNTLAMRQATIQGGLAALHASGATTVSIAAEDSILAGRIALESATTSSTLTLTGSTLDFSASPQNDETLLRFGGSVNIDSSNTLTLPVSFATIDLLDDDQAGVFAPVIQAPGNAFTFDLLSDHSARYSGFTHDSPNGKRLFPAFAAYATGQLQSAARLPDAIVTLSLNPDRLTAESHATQSRVGFHLHTAVLEQARALANPASRLAQNSQTGSVSAQGLVDAAEKGNDTGNGVRFFGGYLRNTRDQSGRDGYAGYDFDADGLVLGVSSDIGHDVELAVFAGATRGETDYRHLSARVETDGLHLGMLGRYSHALSQASTLRFSGHVDYSRLENDARRYTSAAKTTGEYRQNLYGIGLEAALDYRLPSALVLSPRVALDAIRLEQARFRERGDNALDVGSLDLNQSHATLGIDVSRDFALDNGFMLTPKASLGWRHVFNAASRAVTARFRGYSTAFSSLALEEDRNTFLGNLSVDVMRLNTRQPLVVHFEYGYQKQEQASEHQVWLGLEARF
ncbi:MAG: autotransporter domain-containing protein, partial [Zoogloeaceae bacterium]|nr:autotransporter domain-containing protein [Zoogloeaceae bacterium]